MKTRTRNIGIGAGLVLVATVALAAAAGDRLKIPVLIGQGQAVTEKVTFDIGSGATNPFIQATSSGVLQLSSDGTHALSIGTIAGTLSTLAGTESPTNKTFDSTSTMTGVRMASLTPNGTNTVTFPAATATLATNPTTTTGDIVYASNTATPAALARLGVGSATQVLFGGTTPAWGTLNAQGFFSSGCEADSTHRGCVGIGNDAWGGRKSAGNSKIKVYLGSNQAVTSAATNRIKFDTKVFDVNTEFDASGGTTCSNSSNCTGRFTSTHAGYFQVCAQTRIATVLSAANSDYIELRKNGTRTALHTGAGYANQSNEFFQVCDLMSLSSTDFVEAFFTNGEAGTITVDSNAGDQSITFVTIDEVI